jgi:hypothetical protein
MLMQFLDFAFQSFAVWFGVLIMGTSFAYAAAYGACFAVAMVVSLVRGK